MAPKHLAYLLGLLSKWIGCLRPWKKKFNCFSSFFSLDSSTPCRFSAFDKTQDNAIQVSPGIRRQNVLVQALRQVWPACKSTVRSKSICSSKQKRLIPYKGSFACSSPFQTYVVLLGVTQQSLFLFCYLRLLYTLHSTLTANWVFLIAPGRVIYSLRFHFFPYNTIKLNVIKV